MTNATEQDDPFAYLYRSGPSGEITSPLNMEEVVRELGEERTERFLPVTQEQPAVADDIPVVKTTPTRAQSLTQQLWAWLGNWGIQKILLFPTLLVCGLYGGMLLASPESLPDAIVPPGIEVEAKPKTDSSPAPTSSKKQEETAAQPDSAQWQPPTVSARPTSSASPSDSPTPKESNTASPSASASESATTTPSASAPTPSATPSASATSATPTPTTEPTEQVPSASPSSPTAVPSLDSSDGPTTEASAEVAVTATP